MAFENNQQDAFNLRNDTESLKQWQSELDKATTSIGAAEVAAEEELAALKFKNLSALQDARIAKLDQLIALEDKGIRELAKARLTLSDRQFELRKKEIQKEFQLAKNAAEELLKIKNKKTQGQTNKTASSTDDISSASKTKSGAKILSVPKNTSGNKAAPQTNVTAAQQVIVKPAQPPQERVYTDDHSDLQEVDLGKYLFDTVRTMFDASREAIGKQSSDLEKALNEVTANDGKSASQPSVDIARDLLKEFNATEKAIRKVREFNENRDLNGRLTKLAEEQKLRTGHEEAAFTAITAKIAAAAKAEDLKNNEASYFQEAYWAQQQAFASAQNKLTEDNIKNEAALFYARANRDELIAQEDLKLKQEHADATLKAMQTNNAIVAKANDLKHNRELYAQEEYRNLNLAFLAEQNKLTTEGIQAEADLKFIRDNEERILEQKAHELRINQIKAEQAAMQALIDAQAKKDDIEANRERYLEEALHNLKVGHANKENELRVAGINAAAKAQDLSDNKDQYVLEARLARENAFYEKQNKLTEDRINLETEIAWEREHIEEVMAQELQEKRLGYLQDYQKLQLEAGKYTVDQAKYEKDRARKDNKAAKKEAVNGITDGLKKFGTGEFSLTDVQQSYGKYMGQRTAELKEAGMNDASAELTANFELLAEAAGGLAATLDAKVKEISSMQGFVDTRLQGSRVNDRDFGNGSYWNELLEDMKKIAGASPFIKQEKLVDNVKVLVDKGISFDIKQRAFLMTVQEKIANTFNVADGTLLRLIRIQQQDTTAGRLGMESALNSFLNSMYETSEYLENVASSVRGSLEEMQALMEGAAATELEFQVQKWMGSLYSVGMSQEAVQNIARTFGQIASGDVSGLTGSGTGNLLIMAANEAGKSIADILQEGLDAKETNELMQAMVNYLAEIAETSSDSRVVQQQLANVYGMKASDLKAATNLASSIKDVSKQDLTYSGMMGQLNHMMNTIRLRTSVGEGMTNMWDNMMYSMASTQASNPMLYMLPKMADLLRDVTGGDGIALPFLNVMGFGVDLNTSVADLMSVASMAGTALGALGPVLTGLSDLANPLVGSTMLLRAGINPFGKAPVLARGKATPLQNLRGASISESGYIGQGSATDIKNQTMQGAEDDKKKLMIKAKDEESADDVATKANLAVVNIYNLLEEVAHGSQSLRVKLVNTEALRCSGISNSSNPIGGEEGDAPTSMNAGKYGTDNGNWVLAM